MKPERVGVDLGVTRRFGEDGVIVTCDDEAVSAGDRVGTRV